MNYPLDEAVEERAALVSIDEVIKDAKESVSICRPYPDSHYRSCVEAILCYNGMIHYAFECKAVTWGEIHARFLRYDDLKNFLKALDIATDYKGWIK
jgi:hypothetical protein